MRKYLKWVLVGVVVLFAAAQVVRPDRTNPVFDPGVSFSADTTVSAEVRSAIGRACFDCHSNETRWPWYSAVTPVNYLLVNDVEEGRRHLNLSEWGNMKPRKRQRVMEDIADEINSGTMPLAAYRLMHGEAKLSEAEVKLLVLWGQTGGTQERP